jgi:3-oxoacyl-[acyl-carrier protein] reductase
MIDTGLKGKVALITGANNPVGIGAAIAKAFTREGASVLLTYIRLPGQLKNIGDEAIKKATEPGWPFYTAMGMKSASEVLDAIRKEGGVAIAVAADLANPGNVSLLFDKAESELGPVDVLVNNAAHAPDADRLDDLTAEVIDKTYAINTRATLLLTAEFVRRHQDGNRKWGRIINVSTGPAQSFNTQITYGTSKAAIEAATRAIAIEVGPLGITVNTIAPGATQTGYIDNKAEERLIPTIPLRRLGRPEDIANAILFIASDQASWITGQVIRVTGGRDM